MAKYIVWVIIYSTLYLCIIFSWLTTFLFCMTQVKLNGKENDKVFEKKTSALSSLVLILFSKIPFYQTR